MGREETWVKQAIDWGGAMKRVFFGTKGMEEIEEKERFQSFRDERRLGS